MEGIDYKNFDIVANKMRHFFRDIKGFRNGFRTNPLLERWIPYNGTLFQIH